MSKVRANSVRSPIAVMGVAALLVLVPRVALAGPDEKAERLARLKGFDAAAAWARMTRETLDGAALAELDAWFDDALLEAATTRRSLQLVQEHLTTFPASSAHQSALALACQLATEGAEFAQDEGSLRRLIRDKELHCESTAKAALGRVVWRSVEASRSSAALQVFLQNYETHPLIARAREAAALDARHVRSIEALAGGGFARDWQPIAEGAWTKETKIAATAGLLASRARTDCEALAPLGDWLAWRKALHAPACQDPGLRTWMASTIARGLTHPLELHEPQATNVRMAVQAALLAKPSPHANPWDGLDVLGGLNIKPVPRFNVGHSPLTRTATVQFGGEAIPIAGQWHSSDTSTLAVDPRTGVLTSLRDGVATIRFDAAGLSQSFTVRAIREPPSCAPGDASNIARALGYTDQLTAEFAMVAIFQPRGVTIPPAGNLGWSRWVAVPEDPWEHNLWSYIEADTYFLANGNAIIDGLRSWRLRPNYPPGHPATVDPRRHPPRADPCFNVHTTLILREASVSEAYQLLSRCLQLPTEVLGEDVFAYIEAHYPAAPEGTPPPPPFSLTGPATRKAATEVLWAKDSPTELLYLTKPGFHEGLPGFPEAHDTFGTLVNVAFRKGIIEVATLGPGFPLELYRDAWHPGEGSCRKPLINIYSGVGTSTLITFKPGDCE